MTVLLREISEVDFCRHYALMESPFTESFDFSKFYQGGNRISVLEDLLIRIDRGDPRVVVFADEGTGKTALCRMVENERDRDLCLYLNCSSSELERDLEMQLAASLFIEFSQNLSRSAVEDALLHKLSTHDRAVLLIEGVTGITAEQALWLKKIQARASEKSGSICLIFFCSSSEREHLKLLGVEAEAILLQLENLTEYEVYEYLNDHILNCGNRQQEIFRRAVAKAIAKDSKGNFLRIVESAKATLRHCYLRNGKLPTIYDVPIFVKKVDMVVTKKRPVAKVKKSYFTLAMASIAGSALVLAIVWGLFADRIDLPFEKISATVVSLR